MINQEIVFCVYCYKINNGNIFAIKDQQSDVIPLHAKTIEFML